MVMNTEGGVGGGTGSWNAERCGSWSAGNAAAGERKVGGKERGLRVERCESADCSCSVHGTLQARTLEGAAFPFCRDLPDPGIEPTPPRSPALAGRLFTTRATREAAERCSQAPSKGPGSRLQ